MFCSPVPREKLTGARLGAILSPCFRAQECAVLDRPPPRRPRRNMTSADAGRPLAKPRSLHPFALYRAPRAGRETRRPPGRDGLRRGAGAGVARGREWGRGAAIDQPALPPRSGRETPRPARRACGMLPETHRDDVREGETATGRGSRKPAEFRLRICETRHLAPRE